MISCGLPDEEIKSVRLAIRNNRGHRTAEDQESDSDKSRLVNIVLENSQ